MEFDELSNRVIGCAIEVHRELGPGLLESTYEQCLAHELRIFRYNFYVKSMHSLSSRMASACAILRQPQDFAEDSPACFASGKKVAGDGVLI